MLKVLSLGAGVQSTTLLLMSIRGVLPRFDAAIFADTGWEPAPVYDHLAWLELEAKAAGIPLHKVKRGDLREDAIAFRQHAKSTDGKRYASMPLYVLNGDGSQGMIRRQCTSEYKIRPIEEFIRREILKIGFYKHAPRKVVVQSFIGISQDERQRVKHSTAKWKEHVFPLCNIGGDFFHSNFTRRDCVQWLNDHYPERQIPRSACIGCPYRSDKEWDQMKRNDPRAWEDAVDFDRQIRLADEAGSTTRKKLGGLPFIHRSMKPLGEVSLQTDADQWRFGFANECDGMCGN